MMIYNIKSLNKSERRNINSFSGYLPYYSTWNNMNINTTSNLFVTWIVIFVVQILDFLNLIWPEIMNLLWNEFIIQRFSTSSFKQQALQSLYALNYDMPCHNNFSAELIHCSQSRSSCMKEVWDKCEIKCHDYVASLKSCVK